MISFLQVPRPIDVIYSETIFMLWGFKITNSTLFSFFILVLFAVLCFFVIRKFKTLPGKAQVLVEIVYEAIEKLILQITGSRNQTNLVLPFAGSLFLFIAAANLLGNIPGLTSITFGGKPLLRVPTSDFSTTLSLAVAAILLIQLMSIKDFGILGYLGRFIRVKEVYRGFKSGFTEGLLSMVDFSIGFLDIISEFAKIISISLRLFGNIYAGMVLTTVIFGMMAYVAPAFLLIMGLMFAVVQAVVFTSLVTVYYSLSVKPTPQEDI